MNQFNWDQAFTLDFDLNNGLSKHADTTKRYLSQMKNMYQDQEAVEEILKHEDPLIYEFYELGCPERAGDLAFGTTMIHPGKIGNEYYMTKGHFHQIVDTAEVYYTLKGEGYMMLESLDGDWRVERMEIGTGGATFDDVKLMKEHVGDAVKVKAAGGIRDAKTFMKMIECGAQRIGTSAGISIIKEFEAMMKEQGVSTLEI